MLSYTNNEKLIEKFKRNPELLLKRKYLGYRDNVSIMLILFKDNIENLTYVGHKLMRDESFWLKCITEDYSSLSFNYYFREDFDFMLRAFKRNFDVLKYTHLTKDKSFVNTLIELNPENFQFADVEFKKDMYYIFNLLKKGKNSVVVRFADSSLKQNPEFWLNVIKIDPDTIAFLPKRFQKDTRYFIEAVKRKPEIYFNIKNSVFAQSPKFFDCMKNAFKAGLIQSIYEQDLALVDIDALNKEAESMMVDAQIKNKKVERLVDRNKKKHEEALVQAEIQKEEDRKKAEALASQQVSIDMLRTENTEKVFEIREKIKNTNL